MGAEKVDSTACCGNPEQCPGCPMFAAPAQPATAVGEAGRQHRDDCAIQSVPMKVRAGELADAIPTPESGAAMVSIHAWAATEVRAILRAVAGGEVRITPRIQCATAIDWATQEPVLVIGGGA